MKVNPFLAEIMSRHLSPQESARYEALCRRARLLRSTWLIVNWGFFGSLWCFLLGTLELKLPISGLMGTIGIAALSLLVLRILQQHETRRVWNRIVSWEHEAMERAGAVEPGQESSQTARQRDDRDERRKEATS